MVNLLSGRARQSCRASTPRAPRHNPVTIHSAWSNPVTIHSAWSNPVTIHSAWSNPVTIHSAWSNPVTTSQSLSLSLLSRALLTLISAPPSTGNIRLRRRSLIFLYGPPKPVLNDCSRFHIPSFGIDIGCAALTGARPKARTTIILVNVCCRNSMTASRIAMNSCINDIHGIINESPQ